MTLANTGVTAVGSAGGVVEVVGAEGVSVGGVHAAVNAAITMSTRHVRRMSSLWLGFGFVPHLRIGAELRRLLDFIIVDGGVGVDVLIGAEHE